MESIGALSLGDMMVLLEAANKYGLHHVLDETYAWLKAAIANIVRAADSDPDGDSFAELIRLVYDKDDELRDPLKDLVMEHIAGIESFV